MKGFVLALLAAISIAAESKHQTCKRDYDSIGCFQEFYPGELLLNDRDNIDWNNIVPYMHSLACRCDDEARKANKGKTGKDKFVGFALHYYGECYGKTAAQIQKLQSKEHQEHLCVGDQSYTKCIKGTHKECVGVPSAEYVYLFKSKAPKDVDGGYTKWTRWTKCQSECGQGLRIRERTCTNPVPVGKGKDCSDLGENTQSKPCTSKPCPVDGGFTTWTKFDTCSKSCGGGVQSRSRTCTQPAPSAGGNPCDGPTVESQSCNAVPCPVDGKWTDWSKYNECSVKCGGGMKKRTRGCSNPAPQHGGLECKGDAVESKSCNTHKCPVDGGYTKWSRYGKCSRSCGGGVQYRSRTCTNPAPANGGKDCKKLGRATESRPCHKKSCPIKEYTTHCCEGSSVYLKCSGNDRIHIQHAIYGRKSRSICKHWLSWAMKTNCKASSSHRKVAEACRGRKSCRVYAKNGRFGDPCWGTKKYLKVTYRCQH